MTYTSEDGSESETLWNSRDGVSPFIVSSPNTGRPLAHTNRGADRYAPAHTPKVGDRIFVDLTEQRARVFAARRVELILADPAQSPALQEEYETREMAVSDIATQMLETYGVGSPPDVLVVTAGYLEELARARAERALIPGIVVSGSGTVPISVDVESKSVAIERGERCLTFDRQGRPISSDRMEELLRDESYRRLEFTTIEAGDLSDPKTGAYVSTIWLGLDHGLGFGAPIIFETEAMRRGKLCEGRRYATEAQARAGHAKVVAIIRAAVKAEEEARAAVARKKN